MEADHVTMQTPTPATRTFWDGRPAVCRRVWVRIGYIPSSDSRKWYANLGDHNRRAIEVLPEGARHPFYIDDEDAKGWLKVTVARGRRVGLWAAYRKLPPDVLVFSDREANDYAYLHPGQTQHIWKTGWKEEVWCGADTNLPSALFSAVQPDVTIVHLSNCRDCLQAFLEAKYPNEIARSKDTQGSEAADEGIHE